MIIIPQFRLSARVDFLNKDMRGGNPASGWRGVSWTMSDLARHAAAGLAVSVSVYRDGYRKVDNVLETSILGLDFEGGGVTAEDLAEDAFLTGKAGLIMPTASDRPEDPRARVFIPLSRSVTREEYRAIYELFKARYAGKIDTATSDTARFFFGAKQADMSRVYVNDHAVLNVDETLQNTAPSKPAANRAPRNAGVDRILQREAKDSWKNQQRAKSRHDQGIVYARTILDFLVSRNEVLDYETWLKFRLAYQDYTGASDEAFEVMTSHAYWQDEWDTSEEYRKWREDEPNKWSEGEGVGGWYLIYLARSMGVFTYNPVDLQKADITIRSWEDLPEGSYLLSADTGTGKTQAQESVIEKTLAEGGRVVFVVPTRQLAHFAARKRFTQYRPVLYLEDDQKIKAQDELKKARFLVVVAQSFARYVINDENDATRVSLVIFDEIQQQTAAAHRQHGGGDVWSDKQQREYDNAVRLLLDAGVTIHGLDAGINEQTRARFPGIPVVRYEAKIPRAPVTLYNQPGKVIERMLAPRAGLTVVATDTQGGAYGSKALAALIADALPGAVVLRVDSETINRLSREYDQRVIDFMSNPDNEAAKYTHIVYSPTALSGLSVVYPASVVLQFCTYLTPADNRQMKARFRNVGSVHTYYLNARQKSAAVTPERAAARGKVILGERWTERDENAMRQEYIRYLGELDELYQSLAPRDMYAALLEKEGCSVTYEFSEAARRAGQNGGEAVDYSAYEDEHWFDAPDEIADVKTLTDGDYHAFMHRQHILHTVGEGAKHMDIVCNPVGLSQAARGKKPMHVKNAALLTGADSADHYAMNAIIQTDLPPSHIKSYSQRLALTACLNILGYTGEETIKAETWAKRGLEAWEFLAKQRELWDASVPSEKRWERMNDRTDKISALRAMIKHMMSDWFGLEVKRGNRSRIENPETGARLFDLDILGWNDLYDLLYVYEHSMRKLSKRESSIVRLTRVVFPEKAERVMGEALVNFIDWLVGLDATKQNDARDMIKRQVEKGQKPNLSQIVKEINGGYEF